MLSIPRHNAGKHPSAARIPTLARLTLAVLYVVAMLSVGCGGGEKSGKLGRRTLALNEVPENVLAAAQKALPDVKFADAWTNVDRDGNVHSYEIRGQNDKGKIREVRVSKSGEILEME